jgi:hypothetical protein
MQPREVHFDVDGRRFTLYLGLNALSRIEAALELGPRPGVTFCKS